VHRRKTRYSTLPCAHYYNISVIRMQDPKFLIPGTDTQLLTLDENHLLAAVRYIGLNLVRAGLVEVAWACPWSSASAHIRDRDDLLVKVRPMKGVERSPRVGTRELVLGESCPTVG
jgi:hypothetical protein